MDPHDDVILGGVRVGHVRQGQSTDANTAVSNGDGFHDISLLAHGHLSHHYAEALERRGLSYPRALEGRGLS
jgi:hypothetical protein